MAEVLGVVAGAAGLASLAIQLGENACKIRQLFKDYKDAPVMLEEIAFDLETFSITLTYLERNSQTTKGSDSEILERCMRTCERVIKRVRMTVSRLETTLQGSKTKGRAHIVFSQPGIKQLCKELEKAKASLSLAYQLYTESRRSKDSALLLQLVQAQNFALSQQTLLIQSHRHNLQEPQASISNLPPEHKQSITQDGQQIVGKGRELATKSTSENFRKLDSRNSYSRRPRPEYQLKIPTWFTAWFTSEIWTVSLEASLSGWNRTLKTSRYVPENSSIFEACRIGDLEAARELFERGKASPLDYYSDDKIIWGTMTVLSEAIKSGNVQLCKYIIDIGGWPAISTSVDPLSCGRNFDTPWLSSAPELCRLILAQPEMDFSYFLDEDGSSDRPFWWDLCQDVAIFTLFKTIIPFHYEKLSWECRARFALDGCYNGRGPGSYCTPKTFLQMLGEDSIDSRITKCRGFNGKTAVHLAGREICRLAWDLEVSSLWADFAKDLVNLEVDLHIKDVFGATPLHEVASWHRNFEIDSTRCLARWLSALELSGVDLNSYGEAELAIQESGDDEVSALLWSQNFRFGPNIRDWSVYGCTPRYIPIYEARSPPGTWLILDQRQTWTVPWDPEDAEKSSLEPPWRWEVTRTVNLRPRAAGKSVEEDEMPWKFFAAFGISEDDNSEVVRLIARSFKVRQRRQSIGLPVAEMHDRIWTPMHCDSWLPPCHLCVYDNTFKIGDPIPRYVQSGITSGLRRCARGDHVYTMNQLFEDINQQMRQFKRRFRSRDELRNLPYTAYRSGFRNKYGY